MGTNPAWMPLIKFSPQSRGGMEVVGRVEYTVRSRSE